MRRNPRRQVITSYQTRMPDAEYVIVRVRTDAGLDGLGEAPLEHTWTGEDARITKRCIDAYLAPAVIGEDPLRIHQLLTRMNKAIAANPYAKAAVEMALWDILGKASNQPLYTLLGGKVRDR